MVFNAEDYEYSSAVDYEGEKGLQDVIVINNIACSNGTDYKSPPARYMIAL